MTFFKRSPLILTEEITKEEIGFFVIISERLSLDIQFQNTLLE